MADMPLFWCHGSLSRPWGAKSLALADTAERFGLDMVAPDFRSMPDPDRRTAHLAGLLADTPGPVILAGSSMGGYVAARAALSAEVAGLFLLAPALYIPGYAMQDFTNLPRRITVVHGWSDDVIPVDNSIRFARSHQAELHILDDGHRLEASTGTLRALFERFLTDVTSEAETI